MLCCEFSDSAPATKRDSTFSSNGKKGCNASSCDLSVRPSGNVQKAFSKDPVLLGCLVLVCLDPPQFTT